jgi:hypothetical protein
MKKIVSILFVCLFLWGTGGAFLASIGNILIHKAATWSWIDKDKDNAALVTIDGASASRINQREIIYNHNHYDIASVKKVGNKTIYYCYKDSNEDGLWKTFRQMAKSGSSNKSSNSAWAKVFSMMALLPAAPLHNSFFPVTANSQDCSFLYNAPLSAQFSPPPSLV